ncbi:hypothetical protein BHU61_10015 [Macrococcus epidermidis]|uniref:Oligosaccharide repeat unit polymerase n=2 Tax=Macrococcus epidermidis TaxID=1902580 RepID=A0A327ZP49_9STAP|nr:hypothetical protein BHU61_10015 [Macrococcus epidermidis]
MQWIRFVLLPILLALSNGKEGFNYINPSAISLNLSIFLMVVELFASYIFAAILFMYFLNKSSNGKIKDNQPTSLLGNYYIYFVFVLFSIFILIFKGIPEGVVRFFYIAIDGTNGRVGDNKETSNVLIQYIITSGAFVFFMITTWHMYELYKKNGKRIYYYISLIAALYNVSIIVGERRTAQIYIAIVTIYILIQLYPKFKKNIIFTICGVAFVILLFMSIYKFFGAFATGSYITAIQNSNNDISFWARTFQSYYFGPENIASVIEFSDKHQLDMKQLFYDNLRSIFGINFLIDKSAYVTSQIYNLYIYKGVQTTGHVISSVGYGYLYFGIYFSSFFACFNIFISTLLERMAKHSDKIEVKFILTYLLIRFCTNLYVNSPALITFSTILLGTTGLVVMFSSIFKNRKSLKGY